MKPKLTPKQLAELPDSSFAVQGKVRRYPYRDGEGRVVEGRAVEAIIKLNGDSSVEKAEREAAWGRLVGAVREVRPGYVPPPKRF